MTPLNDDAAHILVVDDDRRLRELISRFLREQGYRVTAAAHAAEAFERCGQFLFDGLVLDVMMPGENGFDLAKRIRAISQVPIMMLTARNEAEDRIRGLEIGADDYLPKPFEPRELALRLANILKRRAPPSASPSEATATIRFGDYVFKPQTGELKKGDELIRLTERERDFLRLLGERGGETVAREELSGEGNAFNERAVDVQINRLRRKIEIDPTNPVLLQTVRGVGYRLMVQR